MKRVGKLCFCLAGGLVLNAGLRAADVALADNPYAPIVTRNVFNVNPPKPVDPNAPDPALLPKIKLNGITSASGHSQALFKAAFPAKPGQPAKDQAYILGEGEQQDDIEVTKIDENAGLVTFNNQGTVQELPLTVASASGSSSAPTQGRPGRGPNFPVPRPAPGGGSGGGLIQIGNRFGQSGGNPNLNALNANNGSMGGSANPGSALGVTLAGGLSFSSQPGAVPSSGYSSPQFLPTTMSPEDIQALIAYQHAQALKEGSITAPIFPPTMFDDEAGIPNAPSSPAPPAPPPPGGSASH